MVAKQMKQFLINVEIYLRAGGAVVSSRLGKLRNQTAEGFFYFNHNFVSHLSALLLNKGGTMKKFIRKPQDPFVSRIVTSFVKGEFYCKICGKYYQSRSGIVGHIKKIHSKEIEEKVAEEFPQPQKKLHPFDII